MNRPFPRLEVLGLTAALALAGACTPNTSVKPGAPVLTEMSVVESSATGPVVTTFTSSAVECPTGAATGGMCDPAAPTCRQTAASNWCHCVANGPAPMPACTDAGTPPTVGLLTPAPTPDASDASDRDLQLPISFRPNSMALFVFDRLLDTGPLDPGDAGGVTTAATVTLTPTPAAPVVLSADYASNGSPNEVIFPLWATSAPTDPACCFRPRRPSRPARPSPSPSMGPRSVPRTARPPSPAWGCSRRASSPSACSSAGSRRLAPDHRAAGRRRRLHARADHGDPQHDARDRDLQRRHRQRRRRRDASM